MNDAGYDVADYRDIDPRFGTLADADALIASAHDLGLKVLIDLVPNHSSSEHPWFRPRPRRRTGQPRAGPLHLPGRPRRERRAAAEQLAVGLRRPRLEPGHRGRRLPRPVVPPPLRHHPARLRLAQPRRSRGVPLDHLVLGRPRGRRLPGRRRTRPRQGAGAAGLGGPDHARPVTSRRADPGPPRRSRRRRPMWDQDGVHEIYRVLARAPRLLRRPGPHPLRRGLGRARRTALARYVRPDEMHQAFNFPFLQAHWDADRLPEVVEESYAANDAVGAPTTWVLSNHDVVRHASRLGLRPDPPAAARHPARRTPSPTVVLGLRRARAATTLMLAPARRRLPLPGRGARPARGDRAARRGPPGPRPSTAPAARSTGGTAAGCPIPWVKDAPSFGFGPSERDLAARSPRSTATTPSTSRTGVAGSTLELYRALLATRRAERMGHGALARHPL